MIKPYDYSYRGLIYRALNPQDGDPDARTLLTRALDYAPRDDREAIETVLADGGVTGPNRALLQSVLDPLDGEAA